MSTRDAFAALQASIALAIDDTLLTEGWLDDEARRELVNTLAPQAAAAAALHLAGFENVDPTE